MSQSEPTTYRFVPYVRQGYRSNTQFEDDRTSNPIAGETRTSLSVQIRGKGDRTTDEEAAVALRMYGPGDIVGIDRRQIIRVEPKPGTTNFPPNYFPVVEFDRPDFPWLFSPERPVTETPQERGRYGRGRTRPWLCLVAVEKQPGVSVSVDERRPLPTLEIGGDADPGIELPSLDETWAWAHAQVTGEVDDVADELRGRSPQSLSRLLAPRNLRPNRSYIAALVPVYEPGRQVGLGNDPVPNQEDDSTPTVGLAWDIENPPGTPFRLPAYFHWEFSTGELGDFELLARELEPRNLGPNVGYRQVDVSDPGPDRLQIPSDEDHTVIMGGALTSADDLPADADPWYPTPHTELAGEQDAGMRDLLRQLLNEPAAIEEASGYPAVGPPIYGQWHAGVETIEPRPNPVLPGYYPFWLNELNVDARYRTAAGIGAQVVTEQQERYMELAWEQIAAIREKNRVFRRKGLALSSSVVRFRRLHDVLQRADLWGNRPAADLAEVLLFTGPMHETARWDDLDTTVAQYFEETTLPGSMMTPAFRRMTRTDGPIGRRLAGVTDRAGVSLRDRVLDSETMLATVGDGEISPDRTDVMADRVTTISDRNVARGEVAFGDHVQDFVDVRVEQDRIAGGQLEHLTYDNLAQELGIGGSDPRPDGGTSAEIASYVATTVRPVVLKDTETTTLTQPDIEAAAAAVLRSANPAVSVVGDAATRFGDWVYDRDDPVREVMAEPTFPQPMYEPLKDLSSEYLLPGANEIPPDTVGAVVTNQKFIEAFMTGLNHEMARELLWRRYPTDRRGTYFSHFWEHEDPSKRDITDIHTWDTNDLGENRPDDTHDGDDNRVVLLVKGELLRRYPNTHIYAAKAIEDEDDDGDSDRIPDLHGLDTGAGVTGTEREPIFRGTLEPDITFFGFDLTEAEAVNGTMSGQDPDNELEQGWFFVLEEPVGELRFGLDENQDRGTAPGSDPFKPDDGPAYIHTETDVGTYPAGIVLSDGKLRDEYRNGTRYWPVWDAEVGEEKGWYGLSWGHLVPAGAVPGEQDSTRAQITAEQAAVDAISYVSVTGSAPGGADGFGGARPWKTEAGNWGSPYDADDDETNWRGVDVAEWGKNSAHMARITFQLPVRVAIHADDLLPDPDDEAVGVWTDFLDVGMIRADGGDVGIDERVSGIPDDDDGTDGGRR